MRKSGRWQFARRVPARPNLSQFWRTKIRQSTFLNYTKYGGFRGSKLLEVSVGWLSQETFFYLTTKAINHSDNGHLN